MILLKKKNEDGTYFEFKEILASGYDIDEQPNLINKVQFVNGNRKKIVTNYNDVIIEVNLGCFDGETLAEYLLKATDGEYEYYSLKEKTMKRANFIVTVPQLGIENSSDEILVKDFVMTLEKSSDIV